MTFLLRMMKRFLFSSFCSFCSFLTILIMIYCSTISSTHLTFCTASVWFRLYLSAWNQNTSANDKHFSPDGLCYRLCSRTGSFCSVYIPLPNITSQYPMLTSYMQTIQVYEISYIIQSVEKSVLNATF